VTGMEGDRSFYQLLSVISVQCRFKVDVDVF